MCIRDSSEPRRAPRPSADPQPVRHRQDAVRVEPELGGETRQEAQRIRGDGRRIEPSRAFGGLRRLQPLEQSEQRYGTYGDLLAVEAGQRTGPLDGDLAATEVVDEATLLRVGTGPDAAPGQRLELLDGQAA